MDRLSASSHSLQYRSFLVFIPPCTIIHSACNDTNQDEHNELTASHECCDRMFDCNVYEFHTFCIGRT